MNYTKKRLLDEQKKLSKMAPADRVVAEEAIMAEVAPVEATGEYIPELHADLPLKEEVKEEEKASEFAPTKEEVKKGKK